MHKPIIWALTDDRPGNVNQVLGVAEALALPFEIKNIAYSKHGRLPNFIRGASLLGVDVAKSAPLVAPWPDIVIAAGRKTLPVARYIKKHADKKTKLVQLMWPGFPHWDCDMIVTPMHDDITPGGRVVNTIGAPNRITSATLAAKRDYWEEKFSSLPKPRVVLLVGGTTKKGEFTPEMAHQLAQKINDFLGQSGGSLLVTNSRRTSPEATAVLQKEIKIPMHFHDCRSGDENPYFGYLAISDVIIASGDSISMCSEACTSGKPVYLYAPENLTPEKHQQFHRNLYEKGYARPLDGVLKNWDYTPLAEAKKITALIREKYC